MNERAILLVCAVLAAASSLATCEHDLNFRYLDFSLMQQGLDERTLVIKQALEFLGNIEPANDEFTRVSRIKYRIHDRLELTDLSEPMRSIYSHLMDLVDLRNGPTEGLIERVMEICYLLNDNTYTKVDWFAPFLRNYGRDKFGYYIWQSIDALLREGREENQEAKFELDRAFGLLEKDDNLKLRTLTQLDLSTFDVGRAKEVGIGYLGGRANALASFFSFMSRQCMKLRYGREFHFNVVTLAETFGYYVENMHPKVRILKEYNRLCASAAHEGTRRSMEGENNH